MDLRRATPLAFAATMGLAGFLLFQVQPLLAKYILPWFGGSASTWLVCLLFFQVALLAGYLHAYAVTRPFPVPRQVVIQLSILAGSLLLLPITPPDAWKPQDAGNPTWRILELLALCVGLPYLALATTTPLLSRWLARIDPALDPARFFAVSNLGSFLGLLSYPFGFERMMSGAGQTRLWSWAYGLYAALFAVCGLITLVRTRGDAQADAGASLAAIRSAILLRWVAYSALGSTLLLATTNAVTQWSAVVPFLWIVPLGLYLLSFVAAFAHRSLYDRRLFGAAFLALAATTFLLVEPESTRSFLTQFALQSATLFAGCMLCHGELARLRPHPVRLPAFYLAVAAGGALGGLFVSILAPFAFSDYVEHPFVLAVLAVLAVLLMFRDARARASRWSAVVTGAAALLFAGGLGTAAWREISPERPVIDRVRNFYGVVKTVRESGDGPAEDSLVLQQAGVDQGAQFQAADRRSELVCGYDERSALGLAVAHHARRRGRDQPAPLRIGVVGLGVGMVAALGRAGDAIRYYELNPAVLDLANRRFTFLKDSKARTEVVLGDGRLLLERELKASGPQGFDVLVLNAFRGASPPMHLMTREAFDIYLGHLAAGGILAVNFEFEIFEMGPLHRGMAEALGAEVRWFAPKEGEGCEGAISWALYTRDKAFFEAPQVKAAISPWRDDGKSRIVWTDQDSNLVSIINWKGE
jgi:hypothetical protein